MAGTKTLKRTRQKGAKASRLIAHSPITTQRKIFISSWINPCSIWPSLQASSETSTTRPKSSHQKSKCQPSYSMATTCKTKLTRLQIQANKPVRQRVEEYCQVVFYKKMLTTLKSRRKNAAKVRQVPRRKSTKCNSSKTKTSLHTN